MTRGAAITMAVRTAAADGDSRPRGRNDDELFCRGASAIPTELGYGFPHSGALECRETGSRQTLPSRLRAARCAARSARHSSHDRDFGFGTLCLIRRQRPLSQGADQLIVVIMHCAVPRRLEAGEAPIGSRVRLPVGVAPGRDVISPYQRQRRALRQHHVGPSPRGPPGRGRSGTRPAPS